MHLRVSYYLSRSGVPYSSCCIERKALEDSLKDDEEEEEEDADAPETLALEDDDGMFFVFIEMT